MILLLIDVCIRRNYILLYYYINKKNTFINGNIGGTDKNFLFLLNWLIKLLFCCRKYKMHDLRHVHHLYL